MMGKALRDEQVDVGGSSERDKLVDNGAALRDEPVDDGKALRDEQVDDGGNSERDELVDDGAALRETSRWMMGKL